MKHDFIDKYCHLDSPLHRLDPRTKLLLTLALLVIIGAAQRLLLFAGYYLLLVILVLLSRVPLLYYLKRALLVTPFVVMIVLFMLLSGQSADRLPQPVILRIELVVLKTYASIVLLTLLTSVTRFNCLLWAMRRLKFPQVITTLSRLVYTYAFLLIDELHSAQRAIKSRAPIIRMPKTRLYGDLAASILLKSIHRSQIVYYAMVSRKFSGEFPEGSANHFGKTDLAAGFIFILLAAVFYILWKWNL